MCGEGEFSCQYGSYHFFFEYFSTSFLAISLSALANFNTEFPRFHVTPLSTSSFRLSAASLVSITMSSKNDSVAIFITRSGVTKNIQKYFGISFDVFTILLYVIRDHPSPVLTIWIIYGGYRQRGVLHPHRSGDHRIKSTVSTTISKVRMKHPSIIQRPLFYGFLKIPTNSVEIPSKHIKKWLSNFYIRYFRPRRIQRV